MGADFFAVFLPHCELTPVRKAAAIALIDGLVKGDFSEGLGYSQDNTVQECREEAKNSLEEYSSLSLRRDTGFASFHGFDYLVTGGMSWGDTPTDACDIFYALAIDVLWDQFEKWMEEDVEKRRVAKKA